jgi:hypothetical protein
MTQDVRAVILEFFVVLLLVVVDSDKRVGFGSANHDVGRSSPRRAPALQLLSLFARVVPDHY